MATMIATCGNNAYMVDFDKSKKGDKDKIRTNITKAFSAMNLPVAFYDIKNDVDFKAVAKLAKGKIKGCPNPVTGSPSCSVCGQEITCPIAVRQERNMLRFKIGKLMGRKM